MKPCRKQQNQSAAQPVQSVQPAAAQPAAVMPEARVRRYSHPIRTVKPPPRDPSEETLAYVLEALSRQSEQLDEILRRLDGDNSDTM